MEGHRCRGAVPADNLRKSRKRSNDLPYDLDNDGIVNELDPFMNATSDQVASWDCPSLENPNQSTPTLGVRQKENPTGNNDWDGDGFNNWEDVDDDNDGVLDWLDTMRTATSMMMQTSTISMARCLETTGPMISIQTSMATASPTTLTGMTTMMEYQII